MRFGPRASVAGTLTCLYLVASLRAFVPGLCATQAALSEAEEQCCPVRAEAGRDGDGPVPSLSREKEHPVCALCSLLSSMAPQVALARVDTAAVTDAPAPVLEHEEPRARVPRPSNPHRGPPVLS